MPSTTGTCWRRLQRLSIKRLLSCSMAFLEATTSLSVRLVSSTHPTAKQPPSLQRLPQTHLVTHCFSDSRLRRSDRLSNGNPPFLTGLVSYHRSPSSRSVVFDPGTRSGKAGFMIYESLLGGECSEHHNVLYKLAASGSSKVSMTPPGGKR